MALLLSVQHWWPLERFGQMTTTRELFDSSEKELEEPERPYNTQQACKHRGTECAMHPQQPSIRE